MPVRELEMIKAEWGISCKAIITRARTLGLVTHGYAKNFYIWYNTFAGDPGAWIGSEESRQFDLLVNQALSKGMITVSKAAGLLGEPIDHLMAAMDWQGECRLKVAVKDSCLLIDLEIMRVLDLIKLNAMAVFGC